MIGTCTTIFFTVLPAPATAIILHVYIDNNDVTISDYENMEILHADILIVGNHFVFVSSGTEGVFHNSSTILSFCYLILKAFFFFFLLTSNDLIF